MSGGKIVPVTREQILILAPKARREYLDALAPADTILAEYGINHNPLRLAHFFSEILHETGELRLLEENLNYRAERLMVIWPKRFPTLEFAQRYARNPKALGNKVYGKRMGNRLPDDGYKFRGRGFLMTTGHDNYASVGSRIAVDLVADPDKVLDPRYALRAACVIWQAARCNEKADRDDVVAVRKAINGGTIGISDVKRLLARCKTVWPV